MRSMFFFGGRGLGCTFSSNHLQMVVLFTSGLHRSHLLKVFLQNFCGVTAEIQGALRTSALLLLSNH